MFIRTGSKQESLAVIISDPTRTEYPCVMAIAIQSVLNLRQKDGLIECDPVADFTNGYDAGLIDIDERTRARLIRWIDAGKIITLHTTAKGEYRFGRVDVRSLGLTDDDLLWIDGWQASMDIEAEKRKAEREAAAKRADLAKVATVIQRVAKPKMKRKELRKMLRQQVSDG